MSRAVRLSMVALGLLLTTGCWPIAQSQSTATTPAAPVATMTPAATAPAPAATAPKPAASPVAAAPKPTAPAPTATTAAAKPTAKPEAASTAASPPAVVATSVAGLPSIVTPPAAAPAKPVGNSEPKPVAGAAKPAGGGEAKPAGSGEPKPADALGVAAAAGSAAAANSTDAEATALCGPGAVLSTRAGQQAGRQATVAIAKVDGSYQANVRGQPTFLNDAPYPNHTFTVVIWGSDRRQFQPPPEGAWQGKALCVTGPVEVFQQRPQIVVNSPSQLRAAQ